MCLLRSVAGCDRLGIRIKANMSLLDASVYRVQIATGLFGLYGLRQADPFQYKIACLFRVT